MNLVVNEIFYSLQGEGARAGSANIFVRLQGCLTKYACAQSGVVCDTEFESGKEMTALDLLDYFAKNFPEAESIIWTGGEPAQQLNAEIVEYFKQHGFFQAIETSGLFPVPTNLDYIVVSPKVAEHVLAKNFPNGVDELRYVRRLGQAIPNPSVKARHYFISPHSDGDQINLENLEFCIKLVKEHSKWKLSLQMHKLWKIR